jgi:hypothetical protein
MGLDEEKSAYKADWTTKGYGALLSSDRCTYTLYVKQEAAKKMNRDQFSQADHAAAIQDEKLDK